MIANTISAKMPSSRYISDRSSSCVVAEVLVDEVACAADASDAKRTSPRPGLREVLDSVEVGTPVEILAPVETEASVEIEAPVETLAPVETETPAEVLAPVETEARAELRAPVEILVPVVVDLPVDRVEDEVSSTDGFPDWRLRCDGGTTVRREAKNASNNPIARAGSVFVKPSATMPLVRVHISTQFAFGSAATGAVFKLRQNGTHK